MTNLMTFVFNRHVKNRTTWQDAYIRYHTDDSYLFTLKIQTFRNIFFLTWSVENLFVLQSVAKLTVYLYNQQHSEPEEIIVNPLKAIQQKA